MRFINLTTITDQTVVITPRYDGQVLRLGATEIVTQALVPARIYGTGTVEISEGYWDDVAVVDGNYDGPWFDGNSPSTDVSQHRWVGANNNSESVFETRIQTGSPAKLAALQRGPWIGGQGHSGCRFATAPSYVTNSGYAGGRIGFAASFTEVGDWVFG